MPISKTVASMTAPTMCGMSIGLTRESGATTRSASTARVALPGCLMEVEKKKDVIAAARRAFVFPSFAGAGGMLNEPFVPLPAIEPRVLRFIDHAHTTAAELFDDAIVRNGLADK